MLTAIWVGMQQEGAFEGGFFFFFFFFWKELLEGEKGNNQPGKRKEVENNLGWQSWCKGK
jgi:hypothetical protein